MSTIRKAIPKSEWEVYGSPFVYDNGKRKAVHMIIGKEQQGETQNYIIENIYEDLFKIIMEQPASSRIVVHVDVYSDPQIVIESEGKLVLHNADAAAIRDDILDVLSDNNILISNQIRAVVELRNNAYAQAMLGKATKSLRDVLSNELDMSKRRLNYDFMRLVLKEKFSSIEEEDALTRRFRAFTKEELVSVYGGILEKKNTGVARIEPMKALTEERIPTERIEEVLKNELLRRFIEGSIH